MKREGEPGRVCDKNWFAYWKYPLGPQNCDGKRRRGARQGLRQKIRRHDLKAFAVLKRQGEPGRGCDNPCSRMARNIRVGEGGRARQGLRRFHGARQTSSDVELKREGEPGRDCDYCRRPGQREDEVNLRRKREPVRVCDAIKKPAIMPAMWVAKREEEPGRVCDLA